MHSCREKSVHLDERNYEDSKIRISDVLLLMKEMLFLNFIGHLIDPYYEIP